MKSHPYIGPSSLLPILVILITANFLPVAVSAQGSLTPDTLYLDEVEILGRSVDFFPIQVIPSLKFEFEPVRDLGDFLRQETNVSGIRKGGVAIDPVIRGFKYSQVSVILNGGVKIEGGCPNRMDPVASHVESENITKVEIIKGPYVLKYGPVMGAMVNLQTDQPVPFGKPEIHGEFLYGFESNWNGQREHVSIYGGNEKLFFNVSGGFKGYGSYTAGNGILYNTSFQKIYGNAGAGYAINDHHQITVTYTYDQGKNVLFPALPMDERLDRTQVGTFKYVGRHLSKHWKAIEVQGYLSSVYHVMDNMNRPVSSTMEAVTTVDAMNGGGKLISTFQSGIHKLLAGLDFEHIYKDGNKEMTMRMIMEGDTFVSVKSANVWLDATCTNTGAFTEYRIPLKKLELTCALRVDYNRANSSDTFLLVRDGISYFEDLGSDYLNVSFSFGITKKLFNNLYLNAAIGRGTRSPSLVERFIKLIPVQYDSYDYLGNPQLKPEANHQADLSFEFLHPDLGNFTAGGFFSFVTDYITGKVIPPSVIKPSTQGAPGVKQFINTEKVYLYGFELTYQSPASKKLGLTVSAAATYGTEPEAVKYIITDGQVTGEEIVKNDPLPEIPPLEGTVQLSYKFLKGKLIPKINLRIVSAQNRISQSYGEQATPGFFTASASVAYSPCRYASFLAGVENIFNTPYYEHLNRRIVGSNEHLYEPGRIFFFTTVFKF